MREENLFKTVYRTEPQEYDFVVVEYHKKADSEYERFMNKFIEVEYSEPEPTPSDIPPLSEAEQQSLHDALSAVPLEN